MARKEKTDPGALQRLKNDLRAGQLGPLYLFYGVRPHCIEQLHSDFNIRLFVMKEI